ncbi:gliding motility-associated C-terminal domain-containing protein, partial [Tenacibaculum sp. 1B UA]|uniref:gliding motility-associated C-terminal domain-containing protein n=1 Tax=Tenacibaculum sp. 1B UA TaxID=2922252 RepID=UPI002A2493D9
GAVTVTVSDTDNGGSGCNDSPLVITRTYTLTDCGGLTTELVQIITVHDTVAPTGTAPSDITVACMSEVPVADASAVLDEADNCGGAVTVTVADTDNGGSGCNDSPLIITRTYTLMDCGGLTTNLVQTITVHDTLAPTGTAPSDITVACMNEVPAADASAVLDKADNCGGAVTVTVADTDNGGSGCNDSPLIITRTYTLMDCGGLTTDLVQTITVHDTLAPTGTAPSDITVACMSEVPAADASAVLDEADNCGGAVTVTVADTDNGGLENVAFPLIITRTYTLTDCGGLTTDLVQTIRVEDTIAPNFIGTMPEDMVIEHNIDTIPVAETLTATDNCDEAVTVSFDETITAGNCTGNYTIHRKWTATDKSGLQTVHNQIITVTDTTAPTFNGDVPSDFYTSCDAIPEASKMKAIDKSSEVTITLNEYEEAGECENQYVLVREWTAADACGNSTKHLQRIHVVCEIKDEDVHNAINVGDSSYNNYLKIDGIDCFPENTLRIFNRWGVEVYAEKGYNNEEKVFKGYSNGRSTIGKDKGLPTGNYFYIIDYQFSSDKLNYKTLQKSGFIYINNNK